MFFSSLLPLSPYFHVVCSLLNSYRCCSKLVDHVAAQVIDRECVAGLAPVPVFVINISALAGISTHGQQIGLVTHHILIKKATISLTLAVGGICTVLQTSIDVGLFLFVQGGRNLNLSGENIVRPFL